MGRVLGYIYTSIYYCSKSFPVLLHDVMVGGWIASWVSMLYYVLLSTAVVLPYCCCTGLWVGRSVISCRALLSCVHTGSWVCLFLFLPLYRPHAGIVKRVASDYYSGVLILSFTQKISFARVLCFNPYEGYRSVTPLDAARVNRTNLKNEAEHV